MGWGRQVLRMQLASLWEQAKVKASLFHSVDPEKASSSVLEAHSPEHTPQCQGLLELTED